MPECSFSAVPHMILFQGIYCNQTPCCRHTNPPGCRCRRPRPRPRPRFSPCWVSARPRPRLQRRRFGGSNSAQWAAQWAGARRGGGRRRLPTSASPQPSPQVRRRRLPPRPRPALSLATTTRRHRCGRPLHSGRPSRRRPPRPRSTLSSALALHALKILQRESILNNAQCFYIGNHFVPLQRDANRSTVGVARSTHANFHALVGVGVAGAIE